MKPPGQSPSSAPALLLSGGRLYADPQGPALRHPACTACAGTPAALGRRTVKQHPSDSFATSMSPPWACTRPCAMARPRPARVRRARGSGRGRPGTPARRPGPAPPPATPPQPSRTVMTVSSSVTRRLQAYLTAGGRVARRVSRSRLRMMRRNSVVESRTLAGPLLNLTHDVHALGLRHGPHQRERIGDYVVERHQFEVQVEQAAVDAAEAEEVVDHTVEAAPRCQWSGNSGTWSRDRSRCRPPVPRLAPGSRPRASEDRGRSTTTSSRRDASSERSRTIDSCSCSPISRSWLARLPSSSVGTVEGSASCGR